MNNHKQVTMPFLLKARHIWTHGFIIGLTLGVVGLISYYSITRIPLFPPTGETVSPIPVKARPEQTMPSTPATAPVAPRDPVASLELQLEQVFNGIKETNQKRDLARLLSFYSPNFPELSKRANSITKSWKIYDYQKIDFKIHEIDILAEDTAVAYVTWDVATKNLATQKIKNISKTYQVTFVRESGQWHIIGLKNALW